MLFDVIKDSFIRMESAGPSLQAGRVLALYLFVIILVLLIAGVVYLSVKKRMLPIAGFLSVILAAPVILVCIFYPDVDLLYAHPGGDMTFCMAGQKILPYHPETPSAARRLMALPKLRPKPDRVLMVTVSRAVIHHRCITDILPEVFHMSISVR